MGEPRDLASVALPPWGVETGPIRWNVHDPSQCAGEACCFHNPSDHPLKDAPMGLRLDWGVPLVERRCQHGVGHPDPDSVAWLQRETGQESWGIHGCDGCCRPLWTDEEIAQAEEDMWQDLGGEG